MFYNLIMEEIEEYLKLTSNYKDDYINNNTSLGLDQITSKGLYDGVCYDVDIVLTSLNISPSKRGYKYWKDAVFLNLILSEKEPSICNDIYPAIAKKYNKTPMAVERAMRICFENVMYYLSKSTANIVSDYLKSSLLYPHNGEILIKITKLISSKDFQKNKNSRFNI